MVSTNADETLYIARVESDDAPPNYFIGDRKGKEIAHVFSQYPELNNVPLAHHKKIRYTTRDDIVIEAYLTLPTFGKAPYPTVIHPHGGPGARDYAGFDPWVAYMTSRGYAVMRPNFRGSTGYGFEFAQAQMGRWGLEMQDDITDGVNWLIKEGIGKKEVSIESYALSLKIDEVFSGDTFKEGGFFSKKTFQRWDAMYRQRYIFAPHRIIQLLYNKTPEVMNKLEMPPVQISELTINNK